MYPLINHPKRPQFMRKTYVFWTIFSLFAFSSLLITPAASSSVLPPESAAATILEGKNWSYTVPFRVENQAIIEKLIQCESQGVNIARPDSNGLISWGILQFNGTSTWAEMERRFNFYGSPLMPSDAIRLADLMISGGFLGRWTCARILGLHT